MVWFILGILVGHYAIPDLKRAFKHLRHKDGSN